MKPRPSHLAAGLAFVGLQLWIVTRVVDEPDPGAGTARAESLERRIEQADRRSEAAVVHAAAARAAARQIPPSAPQAPAAGDGEPDEAPLEERLDAAFARQMRDPGWSATADAAARAAMTDRLPAGSWIRDLDCRGSLCRMQIGHASGAGHDALIDALTASRFAWTGPFAVERAGDDGSRMFLGTSCADGEDCAWD